MYCYHYYVAKTREMTMTSTVFMTIVKYLSINTRFARVVFKARPSADNERRAWNVPTRAAIFSRADVDCG